MRNPDKELPDDYCEACRKRVANHETDHGILCDGCFAQLYPKKKIIDTKSQWKPWVLVIAKGLKVHTIAKEFRNVRDAHDFQRSLNAEGFSVQMFPAHQAGLSISLARAEGVDALAKLVL